MSNNGKAVDRSAAPRTVGGNKRARKEEEDKAEQLRQRAGRQKSSHIHAGEGENEDEGVDEDDSGTEDDDTDASDEDEFDGDDSDNEGVEDISVTFEFMDPQPIDFKSMRRLLERFLPGAENTFPVSDMVESILGQAEVGTTVKVEDDVDVYAFATIMPLAKYGEEAWFAHMRRYLLAKAHPEAVRIRLAKVLGGSAHQSSGSGAGKGKGKEGAAVTAAVEGGASNADAPAPSTAPAPAPPSMGLALLLNERVVNMPPELAASILDNLADDVEWAGSKGPAQDRHLYTPLDHMLVIAPCWIERAPRPVHASASALLSGAADPVGAGKEEDAHNATVQYFHWEDALFAEEAVAEFEFVVSPPLHESSVASSAGAGVGRAGSKRKADRPAVPEDEEGGNGEEQSAPTSSSLRAPQLRRVLLVPFSSLRSVANKAKGKVEASRVEEEKMKAANVARLSAALEAGASSSAGAALGIRAGLGAAAGNIKKWAGQGQGTRSNAQKRAGR